MEPANILVIEDDYIVARTIERSLRSDEFHVTLGSRGDKGLFLAHQNPPDLVILDIIMPEMDGYQVDFLTIGQYLPPTRNHAEVKKYYPPQEFVELKNAALRLGFLHVESGPLVRSSYHAQTALQ